MVERMTVMEVKMNEMKKMIENLGKESERSRDEVRDISEKVEKVEKDEGEWTEVVKKGLKKVEKKLDDRLEERDAYEERKIRKQVMDVSMDERRKRRIIVFGLGKTEGESTKEKLERLIDDLDVGVTPVCVIRMGEKEGARGPRPVIVEFNNEKEKWDVLKEKARLRGTEEWKKVFLEMDVARDMRDQRRKWKREEQTQ